jgi:hypothetical protein
MKVSYLHHYLLVSLTKQGIPFLSHPHGSNRSTSAMLKVLYANHKAPDKDLSFQEVLLKMRTVLSQGKYQQIPQLSASRPLDIQ